jgi:hypothetical protein
MQEGLKTSRKIVGEVKMKSKAGLLSLVFLVTLVFVAYGCYRKGYSDAAKNVTAEYANDWNSDPSVEHSTSYSLGYSRGHGAGTAEANQRDFIKCSEDLAQLAVESGNAKVAGKWLVEGYFAPSQLQTAEARFNVRKSGH